MLNISSIADQIFVLAYSALPALLGIILHELSHGLAAKCCGDETASRAGRLTLNPLPHIDPTGLLMFVLTALFSPVVFGWAKPVPVNMRNFVSPRRDLVLVAAAGPLMNLLLAFGFAVLFKLCITFAPQSFYGSAPFEFCLLMFRQGIFVNLGLAWFNLIPLPPLDGSRIVTGLLPFRWAVRYASIERFGFIILFLLLLTDITDKIMLPPVRATLKAILAMTGLN